MTIKRIGLSWVGVADATRSKSFFVDTLGLSIFEEHAEFGWMEVQGEQGGQVVGIGLAGKGDDMKPGVNAVVTMITDTYDQTKIELNKKGINFFGEIAGIPEVPRMICFKDPDGNTFQLVEETAGQTDKISL